MGSSAVAGIGTASLTHHNAIHKAMPASTLRDRFPALLELSRHTDPRADRHAPPWKNRNEYKAMFRAARAR